MPNFEHTITQRTVPVALESRQLATAAPLTGGGTLAADRALSLLYDSSLQVVANSLSVRGLTVAATKTLTVVETGNAVVGGAASANVLPMWSSTQTLIGSAWKFAANAAYLGSGVSVPAARLHLGDDGSNPLIRLVENSVGPHLRACMLIGNWNIGQDLALSSSRDFYLHDGVAARLQLTANTGTLVLSSKSVMRVTDSWLRLNTNDAGSNDFGSGTYALGNFRAGTVEVETVLRRAQDQRGILWTPGTDWVRLGQNNDGTTSFTSGVYTPVAFYTAGTVRGDGGLYIGSDLAWTSYNMPVYGNTLRSINNVRINAAFINSDLYYLQYNAFADNRYGIPTVGLRVGGDLVANGGLYASGGSYGWYVLNGAWRTDQNIRFNGAKNTFGGETVDSQRVRVVSTGNTSTHFPLAVVNSGETATFFYVRGDGQTYVSGSLLVNTTSYSSDRKFKTDICPISDGLELLRRSVPARYHRLDDDRWSYGLVAQDLLDHEGLCELVELNEAGPDGGDPFYSVRYNDYHAITAAAVLQLDARMTALEARQREEP